jgi:hypothetical protein
MLSKDHFSNKLNGVAGRVGKFAEVLFLYRMLQMALRLMPVNLAL